MLIIMYISDIASEVYVSSNINLFADDTKTFSQPNLTLQYFLDKVYDWLQEKKTIPSRFQVLNI